MIFLRIFSAINTLNIHSLLFVRNNISLRKTTSYGTKLHNFFHINELLTNFRAKSIEIGYFYFIMRCKMIINGIIGMPFYDT